MMLNFEQRLFDQQYREDLIGDLARRLGNYTFEVTKQHASNEVTGDDDQHLLAGVNEIGYFRRQSFRVIEYGS
jgi:hypothetical protein